MKLHLRKLMLYGGLSPEVFENIKPRYIQGNASNLCRFTAVVAVAMLLMSLVSLFEPSLQKFTITYLIVSGLNCVLMGLAATVCKKHPQLVMPLVYAFMIILFLFGIYLCTVAEPNEVAVSFVIILFALPLLFADRPVYVIALITAGILLYVLVAELTIRYLPDNARAIQVRGYNYTNIIPYGIVSMLVSTYFMKIKLERLAFIQQTTVLSETDQMTGLLNRRSFSYQLNELGAGPQPLSVTVCSFDLNGLKLANDNLGHSAGDELIRGAAKCITEVFGEYGSLYRTGGDEFIAILTKPELPDPETLRSRLYKRCAAWHGRVVESLSISAGIVCGDGMMNIDELVAKADADMYAEKARHYQESGQKRR